MESLPMVSSVWMLLFFEVGRSLLNENKVVQSRSKNKITNLAVLQSLPVEQQSLHLSCLAMKGPEMAGGDKNPSEALGLVGWWQSPSESL
jgi:hypothetical protein